MTLGFRIGQGFDVHALVPGRALLLGGVRIEHPMGLLGHSDADVLLHAITDAILGAAGLGDIGRMFPDTDPAFKGADSAQLAAHAMAQVRASGWDLGNLDATVIAQTPRIAPYVPQMVARIAAALDCDPTLINIKGKTTERLGFTGRAEGIAAQAVALIVRTPRS
jgi:2-C-methyl-D-erythritol 2,4-cyclodiphosphate synthase